MPPATPSSTRRLAKGRSGGSVTRAGASSRAGRARLGVSLGGAATRNDAIVDVALRQLFERARGQLLVARSGAAGKLVERARILRGHEHAEVLVGRMLGNLERCEDSHDSLSGIRVWNSRSLARAAG